MNTQEKIELLKNCEIENTEKLIVEYVDCGEVVADDGSFTITELPPFYRVRLLCHPAPKSGIRIEVWLPDDWNGRLVGIGNAGMGGTLQLKKYKNYLKKGYTCTHTDLGTSTGSSCGFNNDDVREDYGWRATHLMTVYAKKLIETLYGCPPKYSYFQGASTGGLQAYSEAQRYPNDYNGIHAGVPSIINTAYHTYYMWNYVHLHDKDHNPLFVHDDFLKLSLTAAAYFQSKCDGEPGDCFVSNPYPVPNPVPEYIEYLRNALPELTEQQLEALRAVYSGPVNPETGFQICSGLPIGGERTMESFNGEKCPGVYPFRWAFGPDFDPFTFKFASDFDCFNREMSKYINATDPDLSAFNKAGGKLLAYSGTADTVVLYPETDIYYEKAAQAAGGIEPLMEFFRYYLLPGRSHGSGVGADKLCCADDPTSSSFHALVDWVEKGIVPYELSGVSSDNPDVEGKKPFVRKLYPYGSKEFPFCEHPKTYNNQ